MRTATVSVLISCASLVATTGAWAGQATPASGEKKVYSSTGALLGELSGAGGVGQLTIEQSGISLLVPAYEWKGHLAVPMVTNGGSRLTVLDKAMIDQKITLSSSAGSVQLRLRDVLTPTMFSRTKKPGQIDPSSVFIGVPGNEPAPTSGPTGPIPLVSVPPVPSPSPTPTPKPDKSL